MFFFLLAKPIFNHYRYKFGVNIPIQTKIGSGFYIGHVNSITINGDSLIGKNCNIQQGVTIGQANRGNKIGTPIIGDNVFIGPGAVIYGNIIVGNNVAIGANSVVNSNVPDNSVVAGAPARIVSSRGSNKYVNRIDYPNFN